jgi:hypothetical protein
LFLVAIGEVAFVLLALRVDVAVLEIGEVDVREMHAWSLEQRKTRGCMMFLFCLLTVSERSAAGTREAARGGKDEKAAHVALIKS